MIRPRNLLKTVGKVALKAGKVTLSTGKVALKAGKVTVSALQATGNVALEAGKVTVSTIQTLDQTAKVTIIANIPQEIKDAIQQGKILIPRSVIRTALREYLFQHKLTLVDLSLKQNQCLISALTKKKGITVKIKVALDIEEIEVKQLDSQTTPINSPEINIKLVVVEPLSISGQGLWGVTVIWIAEKIGHGIFGIDFIPENLRGFRQAGHIISIPIQSLNLTKEYQNYLKYVEYIKQVVFVDNGVELSLNPPHWVLQMLTEENPSSSV